MEKLFFYDLETTGVKFWRNGIHQISGEIVIDGRGMEKFNFHVMPNPMAEIEEEALAVGGVTREQIMAYPPMREVHDKIIQMLERYVNKYDKKDKFYLAGYNNTAFDNQFFRAFFKQNGDDYFGSWFWSNSIDVMVLATQHLKGRREEMENFKLSTVAREMGITIDPNKLHDAYYDIWLTQEIYWRITNGDKVGY